MEKTRLGEARWQVKYYAEKVEEDKLNLEKAEVWLAHLEKLEK